MLRFNSVVWVVLMGILSVWAVEAKGMKSSLSADSVSVSGQEGAVDEQSRSTRVSYFYQEAFNHKLAERHSEAFALYQHCLEIDSTHAASYFELGHYLMALNRGEEAGAYFKKAASLAPDNEWYKEILASYYLMARENERAVEALEELSALDSSRVDILSQLVALYSRDQRFEDAIRILDRIEMLEGRSHELSVEKYQLYLRLGEPEKAVHELVLLAEEFSHDSRYKVLMGNLRLMQGEFQEAWDIYEEVRAVDPDNSFLQVATLDYYKATEDYTKFFELRDSLLYSEKADMSMRVNLLQTTIKENIEHEDGKVFIQEVFDSLLSQPQQDAQFLSLYSAYLAHTKASAESIVEVMKRILEVDQRNRMALLHMLQYYHRKQDFTSLADVCRMGVNHYPDELLFHYCLGAAHYQNDEMKEALEAIETGTKHITDESSSEEVSDIYSMLGDLYFHAGRKAEAFQAYDKCLEYNDQNIGCLNNYAYYLSLENTQLDKAEEMSYRTIKAEPTNRTYLDTYAWILFMQGRYAEARLYIDMVLASENTADDEDISGVLWEHAGDIYYHCGEREKALEYWYNALGKEGVTPVLPRKIKKKKYIK